MPEMRLQWEEHVTEAYKSSPKRRQQTPDKGRYANCQPHAGYSSHLSLNIFLPVWVCEEKPPKHRLGSQVGGTSRGETETKKK